MIEESTLGLALETQTTGGEVCVALSPQAATSLTGGQETCQIYFGDGRMVEVHVVYLDPIKSALTGAGTQSEYRQGHVRLGSTALHQKPENEFLSSFQLGSYHVSGIEKKSEAEND